MGGVQFGRRVKLFLVAMDGQRKFLMPDVSPPMGILSLGAYIREHGEAEVRLLHQRAKNCSLEEVIRQAKEFGADIVGISLLSRSAHMLPVLTTGLKTAIPGTLVVLGGPHVSALREMALEGNTADLAVAGEGERSLEEIVKARKALSEYDTIPGIFRRSKEGEIVVNPGNLLLVEDLDSLPFPAYDLVDIRDYWKGQRMVKTPPLPYVAMFSSRGCSYRCFYCHRIFGKSFRAYSAERVVAEMEYLTRTYGVKEVEFLDDTFNHNPQRVLDFSRLVTERNLHVRISFPNALRTDIMTEEVIDALASAGTYFSSFALESGSPRIQELIGKHLKIDRFLRNVDLCTRRGIFSYGFVMLGFPTETEEEMRETIAVACASKLHLASFFNVLPFPGTVLNDQLRKTHPERLKRFSLDADDYASVPTNLSEVPDKRFFALHREAWLRFYTRPCRIARVLLNYPRPYWPLLRFIPNYAWRLAFGSIS